MVHRSWIFQAFPVLLLAAAVIGMGIDPHEGTDVEERPPAAAMVVGVERILSPPDPVPEMRPLPPEPSAPPVSTPHPPPPPPPPPPPVEVAVPVAPPVPVAACSVRVTAEEMTAIVSAHEWEGYAAGDVAHLFLLESAGGCVDVISGTNDYGCTQIHRAYGRDAWVDFERLLVDCPYAVAVARTVWAKRSEAGLCGVCGWYAGRGWLW